MSRGRTENPDTLLGRVAGGDQAAFERLYALTSGRMFGVALRLLRQRDRAEDVVQDAYVTIWRKAASYLPERGAALAWMATIVRHRALDLLRQGALRPVEELDAANEVAAPTLGEGLVEIHALQRCLEELEERSRRCIQMAFIDRYTHEELAERLDAPIGTAKSWIRRGLIRLKKCLDK